MQSEASQGSLVWAEVDLQKLQHNFAHITSFLKSHVKFLATIKANAYGHGLIAIGKKLESLGVDYLGVSNLHEALLLRTHDIHVPILVFGYIGPEDVAIALRNTITISVKDEDVLEAIAQHAHKQGKVVPVHISVDTGMHLYGANTKKALELVLVAQQHKNIFLEGIYSHFADAEAEDLSFAYEQLSLFKQLLASVRQHTVEPPLIHMANGAAVVRMPDAQFTMVRVGTFLFGPQTGEQIQDFMPEQIISLKTKVVHLLSLEPNESIGYAQSFVAAEKRKIACLPIGYGDGFRQSPNWKYVLVHGQRAPIVASVTMDKTAIDVSHIANINIGDEVVLLGRQKDETITLNEIADTVHAANYEILTGLTERVARIYKG